MNLLASAVLFGWIPAALGFFYWLPPRRAVLATMLVGWLFLPFAGLDLPGLHSKQQILSVSLIAGTVLFVPRPFRMAPFQLADWAMALFCIWPLVSTLYNGLGAYDAGSALLGTVLDWGVPWIIGRRFFSDDEGTKALAIGVFAGGVAYLPLCLWEIRLSPQIHATLYGFAQHEFLQTYKWGTYRPMLFMQHGLAVALWMASASLVGLGLVRAGILRRFRGVSLKWAVGALYATTILCKSVGAIALLATGSVVLMAGRRVKGPALLAALALVPPLYVGSRVAFSWSGGELVELAEEFSGSAQAGSLQFRIENDRVLLNQALRQPVTGWGPLGPVQPGPGRVRHACRPRRDVDHPLWSLGGSWPRLGVWCDAHTGAPCRR